jgi:hypothetical protein
MRRHWNRSIDGVRAKAASSEDLMGYDVAENALRNFNVPRVFDAADPKSRVFFAMFDGTGNDMKADPEHMTNIALLYLKLEKIGRRNRNIGAYYKEGPGTQGGVIGLADAAIGSTYQKRIEAMYDRFSLQAEAWLREDPDAQISVVSLGFSRGAEQAAGFTRVVHERGVQNIASKVVEGFADGVNSKTHYTEPPLRQPGTIAQVLGLYDPVASGEPEFFDRRPPPSVVTGFQIKAADEFRAHFPSSSIIAQGLSDSGRFLGVTTAGAHSDIGGGYLLRGLSNRNFNLMATYLNAVAGDGGLFQRLEIPADEKQNVIHDTPWYFPKEAERRVITRIGGAASYHNEAMGIEAVDPVIAQRFAHTVAPVVPNPPPKPAKGYAVLTIDKTDTAAFEDIGRNTEVCRVMLSAVESIQCHGLHDFALKDTNGNKVGQFAVVDQANIGAAPDANGGVRMAVKLGTPLIEQQMTKIITATALQVSRGDDCMTIPVLCPAGEAIGELQMKRVEKTNTLEMDDGYKATFAQDDGYLDTLALG